MITTDHAPMLLLVTITTRAAEIND